MSLLGAMKTYPASILRWLYIVSKSYWMLNRLSNSNDGFDPTSWRQLKLKFINSSNAASFEKSSSQTGLLILSLCSRKTERSDSALTFVISMQPVLRINFRYPSLMSWLIIHVASKGCPSWMTFQGQPNQDSPGWWEAYIIQNAVGGILLHSNAGRIEKCGCNLPTCH